MNTQKGVVKTINAIDKISDKFQKREFSITAEGEYPQILLFQLTQDKCNLIDNFAEGQEIEVHYNVRGREWTNPEGIVKVFNSLEAWKLQ